MYHTVLSIGGRVLLLCGGWPKVTGHTVDTDAFAFIPVEGEAIFEYVTYDISVRFRYALTK